MRVYISSPFLDLKGCRAKAYDALRRIGVDAIGMEDYVASDERPVDKCLGDVRSCDAYVGLLAWRYGYVPDDAPCSVTELEYQTAVRERIPQLLFLLHPEAPWPRASMDRDPARIDALRGEWEKNRIVSHFQTCDELGALVTAAVARRLLEERQQGSGRATEDAEQERRTLQLQLDEIRRQLQSISERIASGAPSGAAATSEQVPRAAATEHPSPDDATFTARGNDGSASRPPAASSDAAREFQGPPPPRPPGPAPVAQSERRTPPSPARMPRKSRGAPGAWAAGGAAIALAATLLLWMRPAANMDFGFVRGDSPAQVGAAPTDTFVISGETTFSRIDSARLDTVALGRVTNLNWAPPLLIAAGIASLLLVGTGLYARRRRAPDAAAARTRDGEPPAPTTLTRISNRPAARSTAPPLSELSQRNRQFLDETQQQVEQRLQALGDPSAP